jgi:L-rhamnose isomerase/sugar isomerase
MSDKSAEQKVSNALDGLAIELPSWVFGNMGTRFGRFLQPAAATTIEEKFADAGQVHELMGITPTLALHVEWDLPNGVQDVPAIKALEKKYGIRAGSINPNLFSRQEYKHGSIANPDPAVRRLGVEHLLECVRIARGLDSADISVWLADGSNYPGTQSIHRRIGWLEETLGELHQNLDPGQRMLVEYKPFEPAFYHTDIADWGMALSLARAAGPQASVLVDTGHHYQSQNVEQIVAWLLHLGMLGGFHLNDRRYADDDLSIGSIDPYQVFRIFHELLYRKFLSSKNGGSDGSPEKQVTFMVDQSHNLKGKIEETVQTIATAQELYAKAALIDQEKLQELQDASSLVEAEELFRSAFWTDTRPLVKEWRRSRGLPVDPLSALRESGYVERIAQERGTKHAATASSYA